MLNFLHEVLQGVIFIYILYTLCDVFKIFRYVSRAHVRDSSKHVILGTQQYKPNEFAAQINLNMDNAWGILRCIVDLVMKQKDGKFLIMKDPNKVPACFHFVNCFCT